MALGGILKGAVTGFIGSGGNPFGAFVGGIAGKNQEKAERQAKEIQRQQQQQIKEFRRNYMALDPSQMLGQISPTLRTTQPQLGFFDRLGNIASNVGNTLLTGFEQALPSVITQKVLGQRPINVGQQPALTTITNVGAQESQGSGSIQAGAPALLPSLISGARSLLKSPAGQLALGGGAGLATSMLTADGKQMRVTRKMKSQLKSLLRMTNNNVTLVGDFLNLNQDQMLFILNKRFRNDGPVVTKAALRKTKQTIRRLHNMQDVLKSITPTSTGRRRAPMKRAMNTTLIKN